MLAFWKSFLIALFLSIIFIFLTDRFLGDPASKGIEQEKKMQRLHTLVDSQKTTIDRLDKENSELSSQCTAKVLVQTEKIISKAPRKFDVTFYTSNAGITRSGCRVRTGSVAADPAVIPMGTRVRFIGFPSPVPDRGMVDDTGDMVKGDAIDIFLWSTEAALHLGIREAEVEWKTDTLGDYIEVKHIQKIKERIHGSYKEQEGRR